MEENKSIQLELYKQAKGWKDFTILAMDQNYVNLTVKLMDNATAAQLAQYKNMSLELTSLSSGQVRRLLMNGRNEYAFTYLPENTNYSLALVNSRGAAVAQIDNIFVQSEHLNVTFPQLKNVHALSLTIKADGQTMPEDKFSNMWLAADNSYLARGTKLVDMLDGQTVKYVVSLERQLASQYEQPDTTVIIVGQSGQPDNIVLPLEPLKNTTVTFSVIDEATHAGIENATVQVSQILPSGVTGNSTSLTTGGDGRAVGEALATWSHITVTSPIHGSKSFNVNLADSTEFTTAFTQADGTQLTLSHTYQAAVAEDVTPTVTVQLSALYLLHPVARRHTADGCGQQCQERHRPRGGKHRGRSAERSGRDAAHRSARLYRGLLLHVKQQPPRCAVVQGRDGRTGEKAGFW